MPNVASVLKAEIARVSRKEIRTALAPLLSANSSLRKQVSELKKQVQELQRIQAKLIKGKVAEVSAEISQEASKAEKPIRITAKGVRSLRRKLKLSRKQFAQLVQVSPQSVCLWEQSEGVLKLRTKAYAGVMDARKLSPTKALKKLAASQKEKTTADADANS